MASQEQIDGLKAKAQELLDAVSGLTADQAAPAPAPAQGSEAPAQGVDPKALEVLQEKVDALAKENAALRAAIQAEIDDSKSDSERLEAAIADHSEPAPVPVISPETVADPAKAEEASPDQPAKSVSAGLS